MKLKILGVLLGVIQILLSFWYFDWNSWNQIIISILLFLGGINVFLSNPQSKLLIQIKRVIRTIIFVMVILLFIRILFVG